MALDNLQELYVEKIKDLYSAEHQIIKALPRVIKGATATALQQALQDHLKLTETHAERLEEVAADLGESPKGKKCVGMEGVLAEGKELFKEKMDADVLDAGIIAAAQTVEHYEIAGYGTAIAWAKLLGYDDAAALLHKTLVEEKEADDALTMLAENMINAAAADQDDSDANGSELTSMDIAGATIWKA